MATQPIDNIYDIEAIRAQNEQVINFLKETKARILDLNNVRVEAKGADLTTFTAATNELNKAIQASNSSIQQTAKAHSELSIAVKAHEQTVNALATAQAKGNALTSQTAVELAKTNLQNQAQAKANKEVAQSVLGLIDNYGLLKKQYEAAANSAKNLGAIALKSGNAGDILNSREASVNAKKLHDALLIIEQDVGQSQRNVGNYTGALHTLQKALSESRTKLDGMSQAERENTSAGQKLQKETDLLSTLVGQQEHGFTSLRREVMNGTQALATMAEQGMSSTPAFKTLQIEVAEAKRGLLEFNNQQKLLSSEVPAIAALTTAAKGLGGAYAIGAGAAGIFAEGDKKVEKELTKMVAIMTVLNGLTELNAFFQQRTAIATALWGAQTNITNFALAIKNFVLTGNLKGTVANTVATEGAALAEGELAVATTAASGAMVVLRGAILATGIGALIVLIGFVVTKFMDMKKASGEAKVSIEEFNLEIERSQEALEGQVKAIEQQNKILEEHAKQRTEDEDELRSERLKREKYLADSIKSLTNQQIKDAQEVAKQYGIVISGSIDSAESAAMIIKRLQNIKAGKNFEEVKEQQKQGLESTIKAFEDIKKNFESVKEKIDESELETEKEKTKAIEDERKKAAAAAKKAAEELKRALAESAKIAEEYKKKNEDAIFKASVDELKILKEKNMAVYSDDKNSLSLRLAGLESYHSSSLELIKRESQHEKEQLKLETDAALAKTKTAKDRQRVLDYITSQNKEIVSKAAMETATIELETSKKKGDAITFDFKRIAEEGKKAYKEIEEAIKKLGQNNSDKYEIEKDNAMLQLFKDYQAGKIKSLEAFNKKKEEIEKTATLLTLNSERQVLLSQIRQFGTSAELEKKLADNKVAINKVSNDEVIKDNTEMLAKKEELFKQAEQTISTFVTAGFDRQKNAIQDVMNKNDEKEKRDIDAVTRSTATEQDKAAKIIQIQARAAAAKTALEQKQKQADIAKAKFEKAVAIVTVVQNVAKAVTADLKDPPKIAFDIAIGALEIAAILAQPIPKYKQGRGHGKSEFAIVGDGGVPEFIHRENGLIERTPAVETLTHLKPKDRVYPNKEEMMRQLGKPNLKIASSGSNVDHAIEMMGIRIEDAVGNINISTTEITKDGWRRQNLRLDDYNKWVNRVIKN